MDIAATVIVPVAQVDTARTIGTPDPENPQWRFNRPLTTDPTGPSNSSAEVTHYVSSGAADAGLLALIVNLPGVIVDYVVTEEHGWQTTIAANGLYTIAEEI